MPIDPPGTVPVTPTGGSTERSLLTPLAGSASYLVYAQGDRLAQDPRELAGPTDQYDEDLYVRTSSGTVTDLGPVPPGLVGYYAFASLARSIVSGTTTTSLGSSRSDFEWDVHWWNLATGQSGTSTLPSSDSYLGSAPDGFVYTDGTQVYDESTAGTVTPLGAPLNGSITRLGGSTDDNGLLLWGIEHPTYMSWDAPGQWVAVPGASNADCVALDATYAGCFTLDGHGDVKATLLVPLDGTAVIRSTAVRSDSLALSGSTLIWRTRGGLASFSAAHRRVVTGSPGLGIPGLGPVVNGDDVYGGLHSDLYAAVTAYGGLVTADRTLSHVYLASDATHASRLMAIPRSHVSAASVVLSAGRLVYADDRRVPDQPAALISTFSTSLRQTDNGVEVGATSLVHAATSPNQEAGSGTVTAYVTSPHNQRLHFVTPGVDQDYRAHDSTTLEASGNRVLYTRDPQDTLSYLYDAVHHRRHQVPNGGMLSFHVVPTALWGHRIAFVKPDGSVWLENAQGRDQRRVTGPTPLPPDIASVFLDGQRVGWSIHRGAHEQDGYRDVHTMAPAVILDRPLVGLSDTGAVLSSAHPRHVNGGVVASYELRTYDGRVVPLLAKQPVLATPQVVGSALTWIDEHGILKVAPVDVTAAAPRSLGDNRTVHDSLRPGHGRFHLQAPYSAVLTSCEVRVRRHGATVRTLPCSRDEMSVGVASVSWDGRHHGHPVAAGSYRYVVRATGSGGAGSRVTGVVHVRRHR